ncbi:MAG: FAD-dependent oxidoreductase [Crocinitomicaceae bacterium]|tara:strand:+ start:3464 stop:4600 length:1137 start_codon:yes stop_codon:yes gene_type:complete
MLNVDKTSYWERKNYFDNVDFLVIGAGIVGYSTAIHLRKKNPKAKILVLERGYLPSGASSKNAGFACFGSPTELGDDIQSFGEAHVWETVKLRLEGLEYLKQLLGKDTIDLQINGSWDLITEGQKDRFDEVAALIPYFNEQLEKITGEKEVYSIDKTISSRFGFEKIYGSFHNRLEGQIDTSKMNTAFYKLAVQLDINTLFGIEALSITHDHKAVVNTNIGKIEAKSVFICTNGFAKQFLKEDDILPARAQVLITKPIENLNIEGTFHYQEGYYYFRNIDNRILFGGGRNLDKIGETTTEIETTRQIQDRLEALLKEVILPNTPFEIDHTWAGIMGVGETKKPIIKKVDTNVYCGVRLGGMGVALGTLVGKELSELID